ncbi:molybdopterin biosynthesis protein [Halomarina oriensis]|uniref:Molybdopterin biosynthesis protein n=1 Tax=Halomarina oriensis TaxID=671145 RepID=A0A6B0GN72_9EURY|nr:molybdopterin biosynthesis protein [Halomarina oriensis]
MRKEFRDLAPPEAAHEAIASLGLAGGTETVTLREARGRVLADRIDAALDVPGFDRASVDGYALRAHDTFGADEADPAVLALAGVVDAGERPDVTVGGGECVEISTGAVVPDGANAVVMVERTDRADREDDAEDAPDRIEVRTSVAPGDRIMFAGADVAAGERALGPGTTLTAREIGLLSALGVDEVPVRAAPRVGIVSTGDELVRPGEPLDSGAGQIYDVNSYTVAAGVEEAGGEAVLYPHAGDDYDAMEDLLRQAAAECDLVLSSGSTSASAVDVIYRVVEEQGDLLLHGVAVKPGKPMLVGRLDGSAYIGLPGYPVSALTIFRTFVAPAIRRAAAVPEPDAATVAGRMAGEERYAEGRLRLMPVGLVDAGVDESLDGTDVGGETLVYPVDKGSGATTSLVEADGLVEMPPDTERLDAGEAVEVRLFSPDVRVPSVVGVGEDDPALSRVLDRLDTPRYLGLGSREGQRRLRNGVPDFAVTTSGGDTGSPTVELGAWTREWGLVVPAGNPDGVTGLAALVDRDLRFVNRTGASGLRTSLADVLAELADERGVTRHDLVSAIDGFEAGRRAHESPPRAVLSGHADVALGLRVTAETLGLGFVPVGEETVRVLGNPARTEKSGVGAFSAQVAGMDDLLDELPGYGRPD